MILNNKHLKLLIDSVKAYPPSSFLFKFLLFESKILVLQFKN